MALAGRFPSLDPFQIRRQRASVVFEMVRRLNDYDARQKTEKGTKTKKKIRRPAGDDWF